MISSSVGVVAVAVDPGAVAANLGRQIGDHRGEFIVVNEIRHAFARRDLGELPSGEAGVHQDHAGSDARRRTHRIDQSAMVAAQHADRRPSLQAVLTPAAGERVGPAVEFGEGQLAPLVDEPQPVGVPA